ncbi:MAG: hypothetical protein GY791_21075 [Alphaproteobacteria bacterium]|nr:hypothetical protein [Alphaproteobacteria bacterium]
MGRNFDQPKVALSPRNKNPYRYRPPIWGISAKSIVRHLGIVFASVACLCCLSAMAVAADVTRQTEEQDISICDEYQSAKNKTTCTELLTNTKSL